MKHLKDLEQVAHYWANQVGTDGKASSLWFSGDTLHSYVEPIAKLLPDGTPMLTTQSWSPTTSAHQSLARRAARRAPVYCRRVQDSVDTNLAYARQEIADRLIEAQSALLVVKKDGKPTVNATNKSTRLRAEALSLAEQANAYLVACQRNGMNIATAMIDTTNLEGVREQLERQREIERLARAQRDAERAEAARGYLEAWRRGETVPNYASLHALPVALRLQRGVPVVDGAPAVGTHSVIQTSHGAEIPVADALRLWPLLQRVRAAGVGWLPGSDLRERRLGVYTLNAIRADGSIKVGCHDIAFSELERMAGELGLLEPQTA